MKNSTNARGKMIRNLLESNGDKFFTVEFTKKDGTLRKMNCRLGVTKYLKGGVSGTAEYEKYLNVYDNQKQAYRSINVETVKSITAGGVTFNVN